MRRMLLLLLVLLSFASTLAAQRVPTPSEHFGFEIGADRQLADWDQLTAYYEALARSSGRVTVDTLGRTTLDRPFVMLTITSPENHARLEELRRINQTLADPRRVSGEQEVERLIEQGRT
ncbi:MAG: peptidase M14, partial [Gemmatimonadota bacterium]|nr:peptidase M14 [Gemmatimonadota bacterium]